MDKLYSNQLSKVVIHDTDLELGRLNYDTEATPSQRIGRTPSMEGRLPKDPTLRALQSMELRVDADPQIKLQKKESMRIWGLGEQEWHLMDQVALFRTLQTTSNGLSNEECQKRLTKYGLNQITPKKQQHWFIKFLLTLVGGFQLMMWTGAVLCFIVVGITTHELDVQNLALGIVLVLVVVVAGMFQTYQEGKSDQVMAALKALSPATVSVVREGKEQTIDATLLVPGDIVKVRFGEKVPADVRVLTSSDLKVNNASLTGENVDIKLGPMANHQELYEAKNIARSGCNFTSGSGTCVVFSTGDNTFFGNIAKATTSIKRPDTLIKKEIKRLIATMGIFAIILGIVFFILAVTSGYTVVEAVIFFIGIVVANVPEGLLPQITVALTLTAKRMQKVGVVVQNLEIIETLGAVTVICSDKTGTLTCNRMTVSHVVYDKEIHVTPQSPIMDGDQFLQFAPSDPHFQALQRIATLNTDATFLTNDDDVLKRETKGDASESAIIKFVEPIRNITEYRKAHTRICSIPFNSNNKWMCAIHEVDDRYILFFKGAPERIMNMCTSAYFKGRNHDMTEALREDFEDINEELAKRGERVLAFAHLELPKDKFPKGFRFDAEAETPNFPLTGLVLIGFLSLIDPPRPSVKPSILECGQAGIRVIMITGDHPTTAHAIAKSINIITGPTQEELDELQKPAPPEGVNSIVIHGSQMITFTEDDWNRVLKHKEIVFARTMPTQKQDIVVHLNKLGHVVAMTGDGVNDAPALKAANVGIAMGSGSAVAKEAGQLMLLNDDFGSIVQGIKEGRVIFDNLKQFISYVLASNVPEIIPFLLFIAMKIPLGIETIMILLIDLGTDLAPAVCLAYEEPEAAIMQKPPRKRTDHIVTPRMMAISYGMIGMFINFAAFFAFMYVYYDHGFTINSMMGAGIKYRMRWSQLAGDQERIDFFTQLCQKNTYYQTVVKGNCEQDFTDFRQKVLAIAQSAFLMTVVWCQLANALVRKTQVSSIFTVQRLFGNKALLYSFVFEIGLICLLVYVPGLNTVFYLTGVEPKWAACGIWMLPVILIWEEVRKYFVRKNPKGIVAKLTVF